MATLTDLGLARRARRMFADTYSPFQYCALGRNDAAESNSDATLGDEITTGGGSRMDADTKQYVATAKAQWIAQWTISATLAVEECAIFDNATLTVLDDCEDAWAAEANVTATADADSKVGTNSSKLAVADAAGAGVLLATEVITSADITSYEYVNMWIKSSVALDANDMQFLLDEDAACASPDKLLDIPALSAGTWTLIELDMGDVAALNAVISIGIKQIVDKGAFNLFIDHVHCPGTILMRHHFAATKNLENGDTLQLTFTETESRA